MIIPGENEGAERSGGEKIGEAIVADFEFDRDEIQSGGGFNRLSRRIGVKGEKRRQRCRECLTHNRRGFSREWTDCKD